ncbi:major facilitator superfamily domain-containing protein [Cryomyces antarcticus]
MENKNATGDRENRWSGWSTNTLATIPDVESEIEDVPPVPPIPSDSQNVPQNNRWSGWSGKTDLSAPDHRLSGVPQEPGAAWAKDSANAHNRSKAKRIYYTVVPASSIYTPSRGEVRMHFNVSPTVALLPYSLYILGLACGCLVSSPFSEAFGRRAVYLACTPVFALFILGSGFSQSVAALVICRFFAGIFGGSALGLGYGTICDIWPLSDTSIPIISYITMSLLGPVIGTLLGGLAIQLYGFRWTQWIALYFTAANLIIILPMQETCRKSILQRRAKREGTVDKWFHPRRKTIESIMFLLYSTVACPLSLLLEEPITGLLSLYVAFILALFYAFFVAFPYVFASVYGFSIASQGLTFLGLGVGCLAGFILFSIHDRSIYKPRVTRWGAGRRAEARQKQWRLSIALPGAVLLPVSLFVFAWTARAGVHWMVPVFAEGLFSMGMLLIVCAVTLYIMDVYKPLHGAHAVASTASLSYVLATALSLFIVPMYERLGTRWAMTLLGVINVPFSIIPLVFIKFGPGLRERTKRKNKP